MPNHNDNNQKCDSKMMWLMMLPCILMPIIFIAILGKSIGSIAGNWQWIMLVIFMIGIHMLMMKFMHSGNENSCHKDKEENENKTTL